jgi:predicted DNA-binding protein
MTLTIELPPEAEAVLLQEAQEQGVTVEQYVTEMIADLLQDREDVAIAEQRLSEPGDSIPWKQLKAEAGLSE